MKNTDRSLSPLSPTLAQKTFPTCSHYSSTPRNLSTTTPLFFPSNSKTPTKNEINTAQTPRSYNLRSDLSSFNRPNSTMSGLILRDPNSESFNAPKSPLLRLAEKKSSKRSIQANSNNQKSAFKNLNSRFHTIAAGKENLKNVPNLMDYLLSVRYTLETRQKGPKRLDSVNSSKNEMKNGDNRRIMTSPDSCFSSSGQENCITSSNDSSSVLRGEPTVQRVNTESSSAISEGCQEEGCQERDYERLSMDSEMERVMGGPGRKDSRKVEINRFLGKVATGIETLDSLRREHNEEKKDFYDNIQKILEGYEIFTDSIIKALRGYTEACVLKLNDEFNREVKRLENDSRDLDDFTSEFEQIEEDIHINFHQIITDIRQKPYAIIMDKYRERLNHFNEFVTKAQQPKSTAGRIPAAYEELTSFKGQIREMFTNVLNETDFADAKLLKYGQKQAASLEINKINSSQDSLHSEPIATRDTIETKGSQVAVEENIRKLDKDMLISFDNREIFKTALESATKEARNLNSTRETHAHILGSNLFKSDSEDFFSNVLSEGKKTPRLTFELEDDQLNDGVNEFTDDLGHHQYHHHECKFSKEPKSPSSKNMFNKALGNVNLQKDKKIPTNPRNLAGFQINMGTSTEPGFLNDSGVKFNCKCDVSMLY